MNKCTKNYVIINEYDRNVDITVNAQNNGIKAETYLDISKIWLFLFLKGD